MGKTKEENQEDAYCILLESSYYHRIKMQNVLRVLDLVGVVIIPVESLTTP